LRRVAVVTGGARRLGRQISYVLAEDGFDLAIIYNSSPKGELEKATKRFQELKRRFRFYKCDIRRISQVKKTTAKIGKDFGKVDLLVNNAGVIKRMKFTEITENIFDDTLAVNLKAGLFISQMILPYLQKSDNPSIINIASLGGIKNWAEYFPYCISKAGMIKLTYLLARELAPKVRVNAIAPGTIVVEGEETGAVTKASWANIPLQKYGNPKDITDAVKFLLNCEYITGQVIVVDGGRTVI
jgi:pteridine reductase